MSATSARRETTRRWPPSSVWTMSLLLLGAGVRCLASVLVHFGPGLERNVACVLAVGFVAAAAHALRGRVRLSRRVVYLQLSAITAVTSFLVAASPSRADAGLSAFAYPWVCLYAAHFLTRRAAYVFATLASAGCAAGIFGSGHNGMLGTWLMVTGTAAAVTVVTASLVDVLRRQSETDPLTGIANRAGFHRLAAQALALTVRLEQPVTVVLCDVDGLKSVNDSRGHAAGDELLTGFAAACQSVLRAGDVLARLGGDEFALLMPNSDDVGAHAMLQRLRCVAEPAFSAGVATWQVGETVDTLLSRADAAMYACKPTSRTRSSAVPEPRMSSANLATS